MKVSHLFRATACVLAIVAVGGCGPTTRTPGTAPSEVALALYEGVIPCADCEGIQMALSLNEADSTYTLRETYLTNRPGVKAFTTSGMWRIVHGHGSDTSAVLCQLGYDKPETMRVFLVTGDRKMEMLARDFSRIESSLNYTLTRSDSVGTTKRFRLR